MTHDLRHVDADGPTPDDLAAIEREWPLIEAEMARPPGLHPGEPVKVVLAPPVLAFLPEYAGLEDPVADLRAVVLEAVRWLGSEVTVLGDEQGQRVAAHLLGLTSREGDEPSYLVMGNGSARRRSRRSSAAGSTSTETQP